MSLTDLVRYLRKPVPFKPKPTSPTVHSEAHQTLSSMTVTERFNLALELLQGCGVELEVSEVQSHKYFMDHHMITDLAPDHVVLSHNVTVHCTMELSPQLVEPLLTHFPYSWLK